MTEFDLSKYRQSFVRDTAEDLQEIAAMKSTKRIPEGSHEVVITKIHTKENGTSVTFTDQEGGRLGFTLIAANAQQAEQTVYLAIPLAQTFKQVIANQDRKVSFVYAKTLKTLSAFGIDPIVFRESVIESDGSSVEQLIGTQCVLINSWPTKQLHLEYDLNAKEHFFETSMGERFASGPLAGPIKLDNSLIGKARFSEAVALANDNNFQLATQMDTNIVSHPTADNSSINDKLKSTLKSQQKSTSAVVNKTKPPFAIMVPKKITSPLE